MTKADLHPKKMMLFIW